MTDDVANGLSSATNIALPVICPTGARERKRQVQLNLTPPTCGLCHRNEGNKRVLLSDVSAARYSISIYAGETGALPGCWTTVPLNFNVTSSLRPLLDPGAG